MKKSTKSILTSSLLAVALGALSVGSTFALFTSQAETEIEVASGKVKVSEKLVIEDMTSALAGSSADYSAYTRQDGWVNGGEAAVGTDGTLTVSRMTPGDELVFKAQMKNESNVNIKYRFVFKAVDSTSLLASGLNITLNDVEYPGLLNYKSEWTYLEPTTNAAFTDLIEGKIFMPLDRDNIFQDLSTTYLLSIEAVQGNASVSSGSSYEVASYLPQAKILDTNKKATIDYAEQGETTASTSVELDFSANSTVVAGQEVTLGVNTVDVVENASSFVVATEGNSAAAAIDLNLFIDNAKVSNGFTALIRTKVASGLDEDSIKIEYQGNPGVAFSNGGTKVALEADVDEVGEFYYNSANGDLVFMTDHFSEYLVTANNIVAYNKTNKISYTNLRNAVDNAKTGDTIVLLKDLDITSSFAAANSRFMINDADLDELTIDGLNHTLTVAGRGLGIAIEKFNLRNIAIINGIAAGRCIDTRGVITELNLDKVVLKTTSSINYVQPLTIGGNNSNPLKLNINDSTIQTSDDGRYGYAIIAFNPIQLVANRSTIAGWACIYLKGIDSSYGSTGSTIQINDSHLISTNIYSGETNAFCAIKIEDGRGNYDIELNNSTIELDAKGDQDQPLIVPQGTKDFDEQTFVLRINSCTLNFKNETLCFLTYGEVIQLNEIYIDGVLLTLE